MVQRSYSSQPTYEEEAPGVPKCHDAICTIGDLLNINYKPVGVREQMRRNMRRIHDTERYPGIIGFDDDVLPSLDRAILAGHDALLVGQMGQAKTMIIRGMAASLLSPIPIVRGGTTNDIPMDLPAADLAGLLKGQKMHNPLRFHTSPDAAEAIMQDGLDTPIDWVDGPTRSRFITATPDTTVKDLVGYMDVIKVAKGIEAYRIESYSAGYLMQSKHGILCIDELPVLDPRKQVALLSILQEGSFMTGSYRIIFEPRLALFATANPVDYTHSGRIIEPLYDRLASHIRTRYPHTVHDEMDIIRQEATLPRCTVAVPMLELVAEAVRRIRQDDRVDQDAGVSVRSGIHSLEVLVAEAARVRPGTSVCPRPSDIWCLEQAVKIRLADMDDTMHNRARITSEILAGSLQESYARMCPADIDAGAIADEFVGKQFVVSQGMSWRDGPDSYRFQLQDFPTLSKIIHDMTPYSIIGGPDPDGLAAVATEITLECLRWRDPPVLERHEDAYGPL